MTAELVFAHVNLKGTGFGVIQDTQKFGIHGLF